MLHALHIAVKINDYLIELKVVHCSTYDKLHTASKINYPIECRHSP
jgi:hypothetical protein